MKTLIIIALMIVLVGVASGQIGLTPTVVEIANLVIRGTKTAVAGIATWSRS